MAAEKTEKCKGLFKPCDKEVTHHLEDPRGQKPPIPLCDEHWRFAQDLTTFLKCNPAFAEEFRTALNKHDN